MSNNKDLDTLKTELITIGWNISKTVPKLDTGCDWYAWAPRSQRETKYNCVLNDKPPLFIIQPHAFIHDPFTGSAEFGLRGELPNGQWVDIKIYLVSIDEVIAMIPQAKKILFASWQAAYESCKE